MSAPTVRLVRPAVTEPKPATRQSIPGSTNYLFAGLMWNENGRVIHAACLETAEFCDCDPRYSPPNGADIRDALSGGAR